MTPCFSNAPVLSVVNSIFAMKDIASWALNTAALRGASYADARIADDRHRALSTKNGKVGSASVSESFGFGVRVIADGAWGFAASDDLSRVGCRSHGGARGRNREGFCPGEATRHPVGSGECGHRRVDLAISD